MIHKETLEECVVCLELQTRCNPFSCMHNVCKDCVETMQRFDKSKCPCCKTPILQQYQISPEPQSFQPTYDDEVFEAVELAGFRTGQRTRIVFTNFVRRVKEIINGRPPPHPISAYNLYIQEILRRETPVTMFS